MVKVFSSLISDIEFKSRKYSYVLLSIPVFNPFHGLLHLVFSLLFYVFVIFVFVFLFFFVFVFVLVFVFRRTVIFLKSNFNWFF